MLSTTLLILYLGSALLDIISDMAYKSIIRASFQMINWKYMV
jgi:hypothetical protein